MRSTLSKGKFGQFQKAPLPHKYMLANNDQNAWPNAYHIYIITGIFLNAEDSFSCRDFPLEGRYIHNIRLLSPRYPIEKVTNPHNALSNFIKGHIMNYSGIYKAIVYV